MQTDGLDKTSHGVCAIHRIDDTGNTGNAGSGILRLIYILPKESIHLIMWCLYLSTTCLLMLGNASMPTPAMHINVNLVHQPPSKRRKAA